MLKHSVIVAAAAMGVLVAAGAAKAEGGDVAAGEKVFKRCVACHSAEEGKHKVGPSLFHIVDRAENVGGYAYSKINEAAHHAGLSWTPENLEHYLEDPQKFLEKFLKHAGKEDEIKGRTKMTFKLPKEKDREDVVAYLKSLQ